MLTLTKFIALRSEESAWHSEESEVYHSTSECPEGKRIEKIKQINGTGGRRHCLRCEKLQEKAWQSSFPKS